MDLHTALLGVISVLVAAMIWLLKAQHGNLAAVLERSDRLLDVRDAEIRAALESLGTAVRAFASFENSEDQIHTAIIERLDGIGRQQEKSLQISDSILIQLRAMHGQLP